MRVQCINDKDRPESIPSSMWVKEKSVYNVTDILKDMHGIEYYVLAEIDLRSLGNPYKGFNSNRFAPIENVNKVVKQYQEVDA